MRGAGVVVYLGPSLSWDEAQQIVPEATIMPPAAVGEIAALRRATAIALIDGYFERMAAPWHKEILLAMERGIAVYGAASMGALRAAELARFGMVGVGVVYQWFARGVIDADDEVAVAHLPEDFGFRPVTDALVNLRAGIDAAPLAPAARTRLVELARARFYRERTWAGLVEDARAAGMSKRVLGVLARHRPVDVKGADARALLRRIARSKIRRVRGVTVPRTWAFQQLLDGAWVP